MEMCPVCNNEDTKKDINGVLDGIIYYFCCDDCKGNFMAEPRKYVNCCENSQIVKNYEGDKNEN